VRHNGEVGVILTNNFILQLLVLGNSLSIPFAFVSLTTEVLDGFIVKQTIGVDATSDLIGN
jgi:hypothetical protein